MSLYFGGVYGITSLIVRGGTLPDRARCES